MTHGELVLVDCPKCEGSGKIFVFKTINVTHNPDLKEKVLDKSVFQSYCESCGHSQVFEYYLLYHDEQSTYMISLVPSEENHLPPEMPEFCIPFKNYRFRVVKSINRLIEKIRIFDNHFNDIQMELLKDAIWTKSLQKIGIEPKDVYFSKVVVEEGYPLLTFDIIRDNRYQKSFSIGGELGGFRDAIDLLYLVNIDNKPGWQWIDFNYPDTVGD